MTQDETQPRPAVTPGDLTAYDVVILDHTDLDRFIEAIGGPTAVPENTTVFTDDDFTRGKVEFNLIVFNDDDSYGIATQLHHPVTASDTVLDGRDDADRDFSDWLMGLA